VCITFLIRYANRIYSTTHYKATSGLSVWLYHIFPHYVTIDAVFGREVVGHEMRVLILSISLSETFLTVRRIQRDIVVNVHRFSCKLSLILLIF
jgi:hypothetical protein